MIPIQHGIRVTSDEDLSHVGVHIDMLMAELGGLVALFESDKSQDNKKGTTIFKNFIADKGMVGPLPSTGGPI
eukprot:7292238-Pyramimonas_sp.AAC.1